MKILFSVDGTIGYVDVVWSWSGSTWKASGGAKTGLVGFCGRHYRMCGFVWVSVAQVRVRLRPRGLIAARRRVL